MEIYENKKGFLFHFKGLDISKNPGAIAAAADLREAIHDSLGE